MLKFTIPVWLGRWFFPEMVDGALGAAIVHGEAKRNKRWWHGILEVNVTAKRND